VLELDKLAEDADADTRCIVVRDGGKIAVSRTASKPYKLGEDLVVQIVDIPGCYLASRVYDATHLITEVIENCDYESLRKEVCDQPTTWYPDLIRAMIEAAYDKNVFVEGGVSVLVAKIEKERKEKNSKNEKGAWKAAVGASPSEPGQISANEAIRRGRGGKSDVPLRDGQSDFAPEFDGDPDQD
jgi:hypothetical protein